MRLRCRQSAPCRLRESGTGEEGNSNDGDGKDTGQRVGRCCNRERERERYTRTSKSAANTLADVLHAQDGVIGNTLQAILHFLRCRLLGRRRGSVGAHGRSTRRDDAERGSAGEDVHRGRDGQIER